MLLLINQELLCYWNLKATEIAFALQLFYFYSKSSVPPLFTLICHQCWLLIGSCVLIWLHPMGGLCALIGCCRFIWLCKGGVCALTGLFFFHFWTPIGWLWELACLLIGQTEFHPFFSIGMYPIHHWLEFPIQFHQSLLKKLLH